MSSSTVPESSRTGEPDPSARPGSFKQSLQSATVYSLAFAVQRAIGFLLLPVYTRAIAPAEYGALGVLLSIASLATVVFSAGLEIAIFRHYFELAADPVRQRRYIGSAWRFLTVYPIAGALAASAISWPIVGRVGPVTGFDVFLTLLGAALGVAAITLPLSVLRAEQNLRKYLAVTATTTFVTPVLTVLFVVVLDQGLRGFLLAIALANGASFVAAAIIMPWDTAGSFDGPMVRRAVRFSLPLLPHTLAHWTLQLADRSVIAGMVTAASVGVYSLASNLAAPLMMVLMSLNQGFMPTYARAGTAPEHAVELRSIVVFQIAAVAGLTLAAALLGGPLVEIMAPPSYHGAGSLVPWIVLGYGFLGLYYIPMNGATLGAGRSKHVWVATAFAASSNIGLLLLLVPAFGVKAAGVASAAGYLILLAGTAIWAHLRPNPVHYAWRRIIPVLVVPFGLYAVAELTTPADPWLALVVRGLWLLAFPIALLAIGVVPRGTLRRVRGG